MTNLPLREGAGPEVRAFLLMQQGVTYDKCGHLAASWSFKAS
jgi:hypothetical protein